MASFRASRGRAGDGVALRLLAPLLFCLALPASQALELRAPEAGFRAPGAALRIAIPADVDAAALERWRLEIDGIELGRFTACSGLSWNAEVVTYQATTEAGAIITQKRPGRVTFDDIVLKRGLSADDKLTKWFDKVKDGGVERKTGSIVLYSANGSEVDRYNFTNGWPSKWSASDLDAGKDDVVIEELTITHEFLERAAG